MMPIRTYNINEIMLSSNVISLRTNFRELYNSIQVPQWRKKKKTVSTPPHTFFIKNWIGKFLGPSALRARETPHHFVKRLESFLRADPEATSRRIMSRLVLPCCGWRWCTGNVMIQGGARMPSRLVFVRIAGQGPTMA